MFKIQYIHIFSENDIKKYLNWYYNLIVSISSCKILVQLLFALNNFHFGSNIVIFSHFYRNQIMKNSENLSPVAQHFFPHFSDKMPQWDIWWHCESPLQGPMPTLAEVCSAYCVIIPLVYKQSIFVLKLEYYIKVSYNTIYYVDSESENFFKI